MKTQITLSVAEAKRLIAKAVVQLPEVKQALQKGKVLLKGGTTVSAISEELGHNPLRISGRISARGTMASKITESEYAHSILIDRGEVRHIDEEIADTSKELGDADVIIISGNALDIDGGVAMMAGSVAGGNPGEALSAMLSEGKAITNSPAERITPRE